MRTLTYLRTGEHIDDREHLLAVSADYFSFSAPVFAQLLAWRRQEVDIRGTEWEEAADAFLEALRRVAEKSDG